MSLFTKATREKAKLRLGLVGPAGSGKTYTALRIASAIVKRIGGRIAVIDSEQESASLYVGEEDADGQVFDFDTVSLTSMRGQYTGENYIRCLRAAAEEGHTVVIVDSLSHAWAGPGGVLEFKDKVTAKSRSKNSFAGWREATPLHNKLIQELLAGPFHLIVTMRSKVEWIIEEDDRGKKVPRKVGMQPVQREGLDYEFDIVGDLEQDTHKMIISKSRCSAVDDEVVTKPGAEFANTVLDWLEKGNEPERPQTWEDVEPEWRTKLPEAGLDLDGDVVAFLRNAGSKHPSELNPDERARYLGRLLNGGREKVDDFLKATRETLRKEFIPRFNGLYPQAKKKNFEGTDDEWKAGANERKSAKAEIEELRHTLQQAWWGCGSLNDVTAAQARYGERSIEWIRSDAFADAVAETLS